MLPHLCTQEASARADVLSQEAQGLRGQLPAVQEDARQRLETWVDLIVIYPGLRVACVICDPQVVVQRLIQLSLPLLLLFKGQRPGLRAMLIGGVTSVNGS